MPTEHTVIRDTYADSVQLMQIQSTVSGSLGLTNSFAVMGTDANKERLRNSGILDSSVLDGVGPSDLVLAAEADDKDTAGSAIEAMKDEITSKAGGSQDSEGSGEIGPPKGLYGAIERLPEAELALISTPGEYATREAWSALHEGLHVHLFSDNVPIEEERALKEYGQEHELLVMGPDCGSAIINGVPLGFANDVDDGTVGVVSAAGTGLQEVTSLLDRAGVGVSEAIGTGGRDLKNAVGGIMMKEGLKALSADDHTDVIVLVSKPPEDETMDALMGHIEDCPKPVVVNFLGSSDEDITGGATPARTLEDAAVAAIEEQETDFSRDELEGGVEGFDHPDAVREAVEGRDLGEREHIRGLYTGGTLCNEAVMLLQDELETVHSNVGLGTALDDPLEPQGHAVVDLGADELTQGQPHPMLHPELRDKQLREQLQDPDVLAILLDVVLGYGVHEDPAGSVVEELEKVPEEERPVVVAPVCGTVGDPQDLQEQVRKLDEAGVHVAPSNAAALDMIHTVLETAGGDK